MIEERYELPEGWEWLPLGSLADYINGRAFKPSEWESEGLPIIRIQNLTNPTAKFHYYSQAIEEKYHVENGDLLISWSATLDAFIWHRGPAVLNQHIFKVRENSNLVERRYLFHAIRAHLESLKSQVHGSGMQHITRGPFEATEIPIAPLPDQRRIVAQIESLFSQSRAARVALDRIPPLLKKFRQSVLASAFRGDLTERDPNDEPASILLEHIRAERRSKWEADLRAKGKDPTQAKYVEPEPPDTSGLPELPEGWVWTTLGLLANIRNGVTKGRDLQGAKTIEVPYLRVANVQSGYLDLTVVKTIAIKTDELPKYRLEPNDILFIEGGDRDKLGRGTVWHNEIENCIHQNHIHCARLYSQAVNPNWISLASQLPYARDYFWDVASQTVNLASLNATSLKALAIPLAPVNEQQRILVSIKTFFAQADAIEQAVALARNRVEKLDQSILARAFRGEL
ncbi:MAG: restriction endonuclease subunit S [Anaerolineae bacterium]